MSYTGLLIDSCTVRRYGEGASSFVSGRDIVFGVVGTPLAGWTDDSTATGTGTLDTTKSLYNGAASLKLVMTNSGAGQQWERRYYKNITVAALEVWSFSAWVQIVALSDAQCVFMVEFLDGSGNEIARLEDFENETSGVNYVLMQWLGLTVPTNAIVARISISIRSTSSGATGEVNAVVFDVEKASVFTTSSAYGKPRAWADQWTDQACRLTTPTGREITIHAEVTIADYKLFMQDVDVTEQDRILLNAITYEILLVQRRSDSAVGHHKELFLRVVR